jgi:hypothetical protein
LKIIYSPTSLNFASAKNWRFQAKILKNLPNGDKRICFRKIERNEILD